MTQTDDWRKPFGEVLGQSVSVSIPSGSILELAGVTTWHGNHEMNCRDLSVMRRGFMMQEVIYDVVG